MSLKRSVNIKYDLQDESILGNYVGTKSHTKILKAVLRGILGTEIRSHIAYGPYGAGKSYISTILTNLLSGNLDNNVQKLIDEFGWFDKDVVNDLSKFITSNNTRYLPVILNGYEYDFEQAVLKGIRSTLKENRIIFRTRNASRVIESIIGNWKQNYPKVYAGFKLFLERNTTSEDKFISLLETDEFEIGKFEEFYKSVSAGAELTIYESENLVDVLEDLGDFLLTKNLGIFIVYDEFGRYIQNLDDSKVSKFFGLLQNLAEYTNKSKNISLLLITHKPIIHYFSKQSSELKAEFAKIEQRFSINEIKSDFETFIKIALSVIKDIRRTSISADYVQIQEQNLNRYSILGQKYISNNTKKDVITQAYPLHPVALFLLPEFSSVFGQNERTLFTFLLDTSSNGLTGFTLRNEGFYYPDMLVDYFFTGEEDKYNDNLREVSLFKKLFETISSVFPKDLVHYAKRIFKFCLIWNITRSNNVYPLNIDLLAYSLDIPVDEVAKCIDIFRKHKMLRMNIRKKYLEIYEASSYDVEDIIRTERTLLKDDKSALVETLNKYNPIKYIYPEDYNLNNDTIRFAQVFLSFSSQNIVVTNRNCDFVINVLVSHNESVPEFIKKGDSLNALLYLQDFQKFKLELAKISAIDSFKRTKLTIEHNQLLSVELEYSKLEALEKVNEAFDLLFTKNTRYFYNGEEIEIVNISEFVNTEIEEKYRLGIKIHNDQINKYTITKQQERATIQLIDEILKENTNKFEYKNEDKGPQFLLHYAINHAENIEEIKQGLVTHIVQNENGSLADLINVLIEKPYGIRPTFAPLVLVYSLIDKWRNIMFFKDGDYIPKLTSQYIYEAGLGRYNCNYNYSDFDFQNQGLLNFIIDTFGLSGENTKDKSLSIRTCSSLYNWFIKLPTIIQLGYLASDEENQFMKFIELSKSNPRKSLLAISRRFQNQHDLLKIKLSLENRFNDFMTIQDQELRKELNIKDWKTWANEQNDLIKRSSELVKICLNEANVLETYAKTFEDLEIQKWPKSMFEVLRSNIKNDCDKIESKLKTSEVIINGKTISVFDVDLSLKALNLKKNILTSINANEKYLAKGEIEKLLVMIIDEYLK